jgi:D-apiose dehydrogenase
MWKVGVVGAGYWAAKHLSAWASHPKVTVTALCDTNEDRLRQRSSLFGIRRENCYTDFSRMLETAGVDIVDILTPPSTHAPIVRAAARHGAHVLCIKPLAETRDAAQEIAAEARKHGIRAMAAENWRWLSPLRRMHALLRGGLIGQPYFAKYSCLEYATPLMGPDVPMDQPFFRQMPRLLLYEMGTHWFDVWRFLFGEPERLYAEARRVSPHIAGDDLAVVTLSRASFLGLIEVSWASRASLEEERRGIEQITVEGEAGTIVMDGGHDIRLIEMGKPVRVLESGCTYDMAESIARMQAHFLACLESGAPFETEIEDNLKTLQLVFSAYESAERHEVITLAGVSR